MASKRMHVSAMLIVIAGIGTSVMAEDQPVPSRSKDRSPIPMDAP